MARTKDRKDRILELYIVDKLEGGKVQLLRDGTHI